MANRTNRNLQDWDPMRDDFNDSSYSPQYQDDNVSEQVNLDFCRLYITGFPADLEQSGLHAIFSKYGTVEQAFIHRSEQKKYAFVHFSSPGEAKHALMKLNKTEPLKLSIHYAHKKNYQNNTNNEKRDRNANKKREGDGKNAGTRHNARERDNYNTQDREESSNSNARSNIAMRHNAQDIEVNSSSVKNNVRERDSYNKSEREEMSFSARNGMWDLEDSHSTSSHGRSSFRMLNGDSNDLDLSIKDDQVLDMDPELQIELERIQLEKLKLQQAQLQCKERLLMKQAERRALAQTAPVSRCVLPGGKVVIRSGNQGLATNNDTDFDIGGGGDSLKIPGLQPTASRLCTACGRPAEAFCARCGITPYCSAACQRRDWADRHRDVCHNLASLTPPAPLRRPRSPTRHTPQHTPQHRSTAAATQERDDGESSSDRAHAKPRQNDAHGQQKQNRFNASRGGNRNDNRTDNRNQNRGDNQNRNDNRGGNRFNRKPAQQQEQEDEEWGSPAPQKPVETPIQKPVEAPVQKPVPVEKPQASTLKPAEPPKTTPPQFKPKSQQPAERPQPPKVNAAATPAKIVPKSYQIETLSVGEEAMLSVDATARDSRTDGEGFVCLSIHAGAQDDYARLCEEYAAACNALPVTINPQPGDSFSYLDSSDGGWYRARCLSATSAALLDSGRIVALNGATCKALPAPYDAIPEYCCLLKANVKLGDSLKCVLKSKTPRGFEVSLENVETGQDMGRGELGRWVPKVEVPTPVTPPAAPAGAAAAAGVAASPSIPEVDRPPLQNKSVVFIVEANTTDRVMVVPADTASQRSFMDALQKPLLFVPTVKPLDTPPTMGQMVIGKHTDGHHYRALVRRTSVNKNKYLLEFVEYGTIQISPLEDLYACPNTLHTSSLPCVTSAAKLKLSALNDTVLTQPAQRYIDTVKETTEMLLTLPDGAASAPSGSEAVLTVVKNKENVNRKIEEMCTPEWKKIEERGGDVVDDVESVMFSEVEYLQLPTNGCQLEVLDFSALNAGQLSVYPSGHSHADYVFTTLTQQMEEYCNSEIGKLPYLPKEEELCIAQYPPYPQWFRAVLIERVNGPGSDQLRLMYIDYGNVAEVSANMLRKMLPEFVRGVPALVCCVEIRDFPANVTDVQFAKAAEFLQLNEEGRGVLQVTRCVPGADPGTYIVDAPALIAAMNCN